MDLEEPVRIKFASAEAGQPLKVFAVCLPFVYAKKPCGAIVVLDTRLRQLVRLNHDCAKMVWKELKAQAEGKLKLI